VNGAVSYLYDAAGNRTQKVSTLPEFPGGLLAARTTRVATQLDRA